MQRSFPTMVSKPLLYVGTVASQSECNVEERNKTTAASDLPDSEVCDDHESDYDQDGNNN